MSEPRSTPPLNLANLAHQAASGRRLVMVTAYDHPSARLAARAGIDLLLVGDSAAMVVFGREATTDVTMEEMLLLTRAVARGAGSAIVVGDLPFMSYQPGDELAIASAGRFIAEGGAHAVKLEGGGRMVDRVRAISEAGMAVVGHLGLTPQSSARLGGFRAQARSGETAKVLLEDAVALEDAGAVAVVLEAIPAEVAAIVTAQLDIPTIGIGAGSDTSGQVLVWHDLLGIAEQVPRFVKRYADMASESEAALRAYAEDVRSGRFPSAEHTYAMSEGEGASLETMPEPVSGAGRATATREG